MHLHSELLCGCVLGDFRRLTFDMRGAQKAQPFAHPLDGRVRRLLPTNDFLENELHEDSADLAIVFDDPALNAERHRIATSFFQRLRLALEHEESTAQCLQSLVHTTTEPRLWWLSRAALRIEQEGRSLLLAIGALRGRKLASRQPQSSQEGIDQHL